MQKDSGIPSGNPPEYLLEMEEAKSRLLLEARLFKAQQRYQEVADNFARAADMEKRWAEWAETEGYQELAIIHRYSELSCWAQAGYPHRALRLIEQLLASSLLSIEQRTDLEQYQTSLNAQFLNWMSEWSAVTTPPVKLTTS